ncbi:hypothetical protein FIV42_07035 [Persicimonas caeni]|uniref:Addiction module protein n=1 Tax=Persicimonas caeni TaxID=2292766 RepID=A0A4Y6PQK1_PERCE|nr:addiction module protein [Persicimonas caeni]QDG50493.1 hypothetical protein FIV42_07035 [Persicimonas caeni]QED31714.1 hypothetical protein FRD00_07030 [Persicimonas caeni]
MSDEKNRRISAGKALEHEGVGISDEQRAELDMRLEAHRKDPSDTRSWREVKAKIKDEQ